MNKVLFVVALLIGLTGVCYADLALDISGSQYETKSTDTVRMRNVVAPGYAGKYWIDLKWDSSILVFVPINAGAENTTPPPTDTILEKTKVALGTWHFTYTIGSVWNDVYTITTVKTDKTNSQGGYSYIGTNKYGQPVAGGYYPNDNDYTLLNLNSTGGGDWYDFYTDGTTVLSGSCYRLIYSISTMSMSKCYSLAGYKTALSSSSSLSTASLSELKNRAIAEGTKYQESDDEVPMSATTAEKFLFLKTLIGQ